ncbi:apoptotic process [Branchiostoma belcheri]|nr:apoptotic process [Branchiostoma belcheri]
MGYSASPSVPASRGSDLPSAVGRSDVQSGCHEDEHGPRTNIEDYPQCPVCEVYFPPGCNEATYDLHVQSHYGRICPMCNNFFDDNTSEAGFIDHVQSHFDHEG